MNEKVLNKHPLELTDTEIDARIEQGLADAEAGRGRPAKEVFDELEREYGLA